MRNDQPETYGIAKKRVDCQVQKSRYNSRSEIQRAFSDLVASLRAPYLLVSFNDEGHLHTGDIERLLTQRGYVASVSLDFKRYVGAQIGIFNPEGERVGTVSHLRNREHLFLVGPSRKIVEFATSSVHARHSSNTQPPEGSGAAKVW
ncbi:MAG: hypothetical protein M1118_08125 [Chloroflexi bacterium]|nr:hypothetical protein [Chloroflexota bacterium]